MCIYVVSAWPVLRSGIPCRPAGAVYRWSLHLVLVALAPGMLSITFPFLPPLVPKGQPWQLGLSADQPEFSWGSSLPPQTTQACEVLQLQRKMQSLAVWLHPQKKGIGVMETSCILYCHPISFILSARKIIAGTGIWLLVASCSQKQWQEKHRHWQPLLESNSSKSGIGEGRG